MTEKMWRIRENQNGISELKHYGVLGMHWGVRKDRSSGGKFGSNKKDSGRLQTQQLIDKPNKADFPTAYEEQKRVDKRIAEAYANLVAINTFNSKHPKYFEQYKDDIKSGFSINSRLNEFLKQQGTSINIDESFERLNELRTRLYTGKVSGDTNPLTDEEIAELENLNTLIGAYNDFFEVYLDEATEEEKKEFEKKRSEMMTKAKDELKKREIVLRGNQRVGFEMMSDRDGVERPVYLFELDNGKRYLIDPDDFRAIDISYERLKEESDSLKDFRNRRSSTRTREKNTSTITNPVSLQKRESINISDKERKEKLISSKKAQEEGAEILKNLLKIGATQTQARKEQMKRSRNYKVSNRR